MSGTLLAHLSCANLQNHTISHAIILKQFTIHFLVKRKSKRRSRKLTSSQCAVPGHQYIRVWREQSPPALPPLLCPFHMPCWYCVFCCSYCFCCCCCCMQRWSCCSRGCICEYNGCCGGCGGCEGGAEFGTRCGPPIAKEQQQDIRNQATRKLRKQKVLRRIDVQHSRQNLITTQLRHDTITRHNHDTTQSRHNGSRFTTCTYCSSSRGISKTQEK